MTALRRPDACPHHWIAGYYKAGGPTHRICAECGRAEWRYPGGKWYVSRETK
jgi:hypothetical protein